MGMISALFGQIFGGGRNVIAETAEVFRVNSENEAQRTADFQASSLSQFGLEFTHARKGWFDRAVDGLNRLPRPAMALGIIGLFASAMVDPVWFSERMAGLALVPEPLWWFWGVVASFYFGARHQAKTQGFQKSIAATIAAGSRMKAATEDDAPVQSTTPAAADTQTDAELTAATLEVDTDGNAALEDWRAAQ